MFSYDDDYDYDYNFDESLHRNAKKTDHPIDPQTEWVAQLSFLPKRSSPQIGDDSSSVLTHGAQSIIIRWQTAFHGLLVRSFRNPLSLLRDYKRQGKTERGIRIILRILRIVFASLESIFRSPRERAWYRTATYLRYKPKTFSVSMDER
mmetsp:Transcript_19251/g.53668  ORF Transcript_19251/g.53668 Transcript_19251/m.53668 type:complete len:149 (+) Transcript_19251:312-758(+)